MRPKISLLAPGPRSRSLPLSFCAQFDAAQGELPECALRGRADGWLAAVGQGAPNHVRSVVQVVRSLSCRPDVSDEHAVLMLRVALRALAGLLPTAVEEAFMRQAVWSPSTVIAGGRMLHIVARDLRLLEGQPYRVRALIVSTALWFESLEASSRTETLRAAG